MFSLLKKWDITGIPYPSHSPLSQGKRPSWQQQDVPKDLTARCSKAASLLLYKLIIELWMQDGAPKIAKLVYKSNNCGL